MLLRDLHSYFLEYTITVPLFALFFAICVKGFVHALKGHFSMARMFGSGGMPSAHSTFVVSLATSMGMKFGVWSDMFLMALVFSIIIIYDAMNVRYQAGLHAKILNRMNHPKEEELNESIGHTPAEALVGGIIGFWTAVLLLGV